MHPTEMHKDLFDLYMMQIIQGMYAAIELCKATHCENCPLTPDECIVFRDSINDEVAEDWLKRWAEMTGRTQIECRTIMERGIGFLRDFIQELHKKPVRKPDPGKLGLEGGSKSNDGSEHK